GSTDINRTFHPNTKEYTFSAPHGTFSKINHTLGNKANLNRYKKNEITPFILSFHHGLKLDSNNKRNNRKPTNSWKLSKSLLNDFLEFSENEYANIPKFMGYIPSSAKRKVHSMK
ncbi:hypothetical protein ACQP3J_27720, partial [Escherichia coli]